MVSNLAPLQHGAGVQHSFLRGRGGLLGHGRGQRVGGAARRGVLPAVRGRRAAGNRGYSARGATSKVHPPTALTPAAIKAYAAAAAAYVAAALTQHCLQASRITFT